MRIIKKSYKYYEVISETAKFFKARELKYELATESDFCRYGEVTKYTEVYESGVYEPGAKILRILRFSKSKYSAKEVPNTWRILRVVVKISQKALGSSKLIKE